MERRAHRGWTGTSVLALTLALVATGTASAGAKRGQNRSGTATPSVTITSRPADTTTSTSAAIAFTTRNARLVECSLDRGTFANCASPQSYYGLVPGVHQFVVRVTRNTLTATATTAWQIVTPAPPAPQPPAWSVNSSPANGATVSGSVNWQATTSRSVSSVDFYID